MQLIHNNSQEMNHWRRCDVDLNLTSANVLPVRPDGA